MGILSKIWTNALFVLQVDTKTITKIMPVIVVATFKVQVMGIKGRGRVQGLKMRHPGEHSFLDLASTFAQFAVAEFC
jgi:hypothetical protein